MPKPKSPPQRQSVEQGPAKDDETRLETFERITEQRNDETLIRSDAPANEPLETND